MLKQKIRNWVRDGKKLKKSITYSLKWIFSRL